MISEQDN